MTGGLGVIGSFVVRELLGMGIEVATFNRSDDISLVKDLKGQFILLRGDVRDADALEVALRESKSDRIIHLAAVLPKVLAERPDFGTSVNVNGTVAVLEAARRADVRRVVVASTQGVYSQASGAHEHPTYAPITEDYPTGPSSYYGATKLMTEYAVRHYSQLFGLDTIVLRFAQTYGPGKIQRHGALALMSRIIESAAADQPLSIPRGGDQKMDMIYNGDVGAGLAKAAVVEAPSERTIHLGSGQAITLRDVVTTVVETTESRATIEVGGGLDPIGSDGTRVNYLIFDTSRAERVLGWQPRFDIRRAVDHYLDVMRRLDIPLLGSTTG